MVFHQPHRQESFAPGYKISDEMYSQRDERGAALPPFRSGTAERHTFPSSYPRPSRANSQGGRERSRDGVKNREVFPAAATDGFTAARNMTSRDHLFWQIHLLQERLVPRVVS